MKKPIQYTYFFALPLLSILACHADISEAASEGGNAPIPTTIKVSPQPFLMGSPESEKGRKPTESPQHFITLRNAIEVGTTEVTKAQYAYFVQLTGYEPINRCLTNEKQGVWQELNNRNWLNPGFEQTENHPVVCINWFDAKAYTQWLSKLTGEKWRLPSEAEWEFFARAGTNTRYSNDGDEQSLCDIANISVPNACPRQNIKTLPVASLNPNAFQLFDVHGNVFEWTTDCYHENYQQAPDDGSAWETNCEAINRSEVTYTDLAVLRGGSFGSPPSYARSATRSWSEKRMGHINVGFRVVKELPH
ncbi:formylglycine-generating enzyme family protein [Aurantivibrio plasticivorans]